MILMHTKPHFVCQNISQVFSMVLGIYNFGTTIDMEMMEIFFQNILHTRQLLRDVIDFAHLFVPLMALDESINKKGFVGITGIL